MSTTQELNYFSDPLPIWYQRPSFERPFSPKHTFNIGPELEYTNATYQLNLLTNLDTPKHLTTFTNH